MLGARCRSLTTNTDTPTCLPESDRTRVDSRVELLHLSTEQGPSWWEFIVRGPIRIRSRGVLQWPNAGYRPRSSSDRDEDPEQPFGDVVAYATYVAEQI
jgi:hypothetical protein